MEAGIWPIHNPLGPPVLCRVEVYVIHVRGEIRVVADQVLRETAPTESALTPLDPVLGVSLAAGNGA